ncbi:hypothetical protein INR49_015514 [Caranx melampygus]|nr:hypothetical protein INR49_015514 [Caranx melampygus]
MGFIQTKIRTALHKLSADELLLDTTCSSINVSVRQEQQASPASHLAPFLCYTLKTSKETPEVSDELLSITQSIEDATNGTAPEQGCTLPQFTDDVHKYEFVQCVLLLLDQRLRKAKI